MAFYLFLHITLCAPMFLCFEYEERQATKKKKAQNKSGFVLRSVATSAAAKQWQTRI